MVVSEVGVRQSLERDPIALGLVGALLLGSLAAAVCAAIGLIVGAIVTTRERRMETALLRALGMSRRGVTTGVALDNGYLLAFGLPAGIGLGILIAMIVLPNTPLNRTGLAVVPAPHVVIPVETLAGLVVVGIVLLIVTIVAASRAANGVGIADVLRAGDD
jgi:putative ABC transport system permease protein